MCTETTERLTADGNGVAGIAVSVVSRVAAVVAVAEGGSPLQVLVVGAGLQLVRCFGGRCWARFDRLPGCGRLLRGRDGRHDRNEGDEGEEQGLGGWEERMSGFMSARDAITSTV
uniref:Uncharacterized protein n=1 Tax=Anopheles merus TaxID=30066 RepID=A0A182ULU9_ANOME